MGKRLLAVLLVAWLGAAGVGASASARTGSLGPLPARGLAVATRHATIFLDFHGHELGRVPRSYGLSRSPHGELLLSSGDGSTTSVLRPATGAIVRVAPQTLARAPAWAHRAGCRAVAARATTWYLSCRQGILAVARGKQPRRLTGAPPGRDHEWVELAPSPNGRTLLANASRECDGRRAYVVPARGGTPRSLVAGDAAFGVGWTSGGEAVVWLPHGACSGKPARPGVYAIGLHGRRALTGSAVIAAATWGS
jgi:hypothetical protein